MKESAEERIIKCIQDELKVLLSEYDKEQDPQTCDDISEALEICDTILNYNYFRKSEEIIDKYNGKLEDTHAKWKKLYKAEIREKRLDMKKLFTIITYKIEDWC